MPGPTKTQILSYLTGLPGRSSQKVVVGQNISHRRLLLRDSYEDWFIQLLSDSGRMPGQLGVAFERTDPSFTDDDKELMCWLMIDYWNAGGLVQLSQHHNNPWTGNGSNDTTRPAWGLEDLVNPAEAVYTDWHDYLDELAGWMDLLAAHDVVFIFRPFLEIPASWFWWGPQGTEWTTNQARFIASFQAAYQDVHDYLAVTHGLADNIIWAYTTSNRYGRDLSLCYPGNNYVDLVGCSTYSDTFTLTAPGYSELTGIGKPFYFAEAGRALVHSGAWSNLTFWNSIKASYPDAVMLHVWGGYDGGSEAIIVNDDYIPFMNDSWAVCRGMVTPNENVCGIPYEQNDTTSYDDETDADGDMATAAPGLNATSYRLNLTIDDATPAYGSRYIQALGDNLNWEFYFDPNGVTLGTDDEITLLEIELDDSSSFATTVLSYDGSNYVVFCRFWYDDSSSIVTDSITVTDAAHLFQAWITRPTNATSSDGSYQIAIDSALSSAGGGIDNYDIWDDIWTVNFGAVIVTDATTSGTVYVDELYMDRAAAELEPAAPPQPAAPGYLGLAQKRPSELIDLLRADVQMRAEPNFAWKSLASSFLSLPGLRGVWSMGNVAYSATPQVYDLTGQGLDLTNNNSVTFGYDNLIPYANFTGGLTQSLSDADGGAGGPTDITGTETYIDSGKRGLTLGGWFYVDNWTADQNAFFISKGELAGNNRSYALYHNELSLAFRIYDNANNVWHVYQLDTVIQDVWFFVCGRFVPSTETKLWYNGTTAINTVGIPASIFDSTAAFTIGARSDNLLGMDGYASIVFLSAMALSDAIINTLYEQSRVMFNVL